ncbi:TATA box-binding protein-associated factor RNA polymerase I subunit C [Gracilinanus agilis]|uniref:TATA box-binding protein-associated factor RNA polymerase I subunit C n=1 Tax=Gracilinanus agilis TaxID=191870 RepID=UPI001CFE3760|nr:TATA box-binding protein-associated factor RNA polymerase I subunit C [Gracilinanus agilis]
MDFPDNLFPTFFLPGPPGLNDSPGSFLAPAWSDYMQLLKPPQTQDPSVSPQHEASYVAKWGRWTSDTPGPLPFLHPGADPWDAELTSQDLLFQGRWKHPSRARVTVDVIEQLNQFLWDHGDIAFGPLGRLLQENFNLGEPKKSCKGRKVVNAERLLQDLSGHQPKGCPWAHLSTRQRRFSLLGGAVLGQEVEGLLGGLLHEELESRWKKLLLDEASTGGALGWVPGAEPQVGQLVYPTGRAHNQLNFQKVRLSPASDPRALGEPIRVLLRGPVRQVVTRTIQGEGECAERPLGGPVSTLCPALIARRLPDLAPGAPPPQTSGLTPALSSALLAVRSDHHCAVWQVSRQGRPEPLQVLDTEKGATGISLSPHLPAELAVCTRSGAVCLWSPRNGLQQIHHDPETLVFKDPSTWRWADFTAHPRVLTVADRTGITLTDVRGPSDGGALLFRVGAEASCQRGERVLLAQALGTSAPGSLSPTLHLVCTQFSLYLLDERLPLVPMMKWNHELMSPPLLAQLLPPPQPGAPLPLLLGGLGGHLRMLHLSGDSACTPRLAAPPQSLPSPIDSLPGFPGLEPHGQQLLRERLQAPLTGLVAVVPPRCLSPTMLLFQLSAAGDTFYQRLRLQPDADSLPDASSPCDHAGDPGLDSHPQTSAPPSLDAAPDPRAVSWKPRAVACCRRWLKTLLQAPPALPPWTPPTFSQHHLRWSREEEAKGKVREGLQAAMTEDRLLQQGDLGPLPSSDPPPGHEPFGPEDKLSERLEASWEGKGALWWDSQQSGSQAPRKRQSREKKRTQLSSSFSSVRTNSDFSDLNSSFYYPHETPSPIHRPPEASQSLELSQELWAKSVPRERRQTLRDYLAVLPSLDSESYSAPQAQDLGSQTIPPSDPGRCSVPHSQNPGSQSLYSFDPEFSSLFHSQNSSVHTLPSRPTPSLAGSQPLKKKPRMGF